MRILYLPHQYLQQRQHEKKRWIYPVRLAAEATYYEKKGHTVHWGEAQGRYDKIISEPEGLPFLELPKPNRTLTKAHSPIYQSNGNFKFTPGTYIMAANGCWHGKCTFCVENKERYEVREVEDVISEIEECKSLGFKEVFDDSATFPTGIWLEEFVNKFSRVSNGVRFSCNMRITNDVDWVALRSSGFRMLLFGIESANQQTLDKINKGVKVEDIIPTIKRAADAGLEPHLACMFGYPWEDEEAAHRTLQSVHYLLRRGYAKTAQASFYCPQGVPGNEAHRKFIKQIYKVALYPDFWWMTLRDIRTKDDIKYLWRKIKSFLY